MLSNISGNIQVTPGNGERIEVEALKHAWAPKIEQAKQRLADALIETYATGNRVELRVESGERRDSDASRSSSTSRCRPTRRSISEPFRATSG